MTPNILRFEVQRLHALAQEKEARVRKNLVEASEMSSGNIYYSVAALAEVEETLLWLTEATNAIVALEDSQVAEMLIEVVDMARGVSGATGVFRAVKTKARKGICAELESLAHSASL